MDKICSECNGTGEMPNDHIPTIDCKKCNGEGIMDKTRTTEEIIEELENCFLGHDEYILHLLAELKVSRDKEIRELKAFKKIHYPMLESGNIVREQLKAEIKKLKAEVEHLAICLNKAGLKS